MISHLCGFVYICFFEAFGTRQAKARYLRGFLNVSDVCLDAQGPDHVKLVFVQLH